MNKRIILFLVVILTISAGVYAVTRIGVDKRVENVVENKKICEVDSLNFGDVVRIEGSNIDWIYVGKNETGTPIIISKTQTKEKLSIESKDYVNSKDVINSECEKLYSVNNLKVRNLNIEDVNYILKYNGPKGEYINASVNPVTSLEPFSVAELESRRYGWLNYRQVPNNSSQKFKEYLSDFYTYIGSKYASKTSKEYHAIFTEEEYFLASTCAEAYFDKGYVEYIVRSVGFGLVNGNAVFISNGNQNTVTCSLRPVIELENNVKFELKDGYFIMSQERKRFKLVFTKFIT